MLENEEVTRLKKSLTLYCRHIILITIKTTVSARPTENRKARKGKKQTSTNDGKTRSHANSNLKSIRTSRD